VLWGLTWMPLKHFGRFGIEGALVTLFAHGAVGLVAIPFLIRRRTAWLSHAGALSFLALSGGLANLAFASAMVLGNVTRVMVLFYLLPAWGVLGARFLLGERIDRTRAASLIFALGGAFLVLGGHRVVAEPPTWVDGLAVTAGIALALNNVVFRKAQALPISTKVAAVFVGSLAWALFAVVVSAAFAKASAPLVVWAEVVGFGVIWILLATAGTLFGVHHLEAGRSSVLIVMELVAAVVSFSLVMRHVPSAGECLGGVLVLTSALLEGFRAGQKAPPHEPVQAGS